MPTIANAPSGANTSIAGTEKLPLSGSQYTTPADLWTYTRGLDNCYTLSAGFAATNPTDATTYYFGCFPHVALGTTAAVNRVYFQRNGIVIGADIFMVATTGTSETSTMSFRLNNTTDTTISSAVALNASPFHVQTTGLSITVNAGHYFEIKWVTPTWVTDPTGVLGFVSVFVK